ncbi:MAG TPA: protein kinase [Gemmatimonadales bacterium]|nr:protein kinase [Gemmatimonadales bacterium]
MSATRPGRRFPLTLKVFAATALVVVVVLGGTLALVSAQATRGADEALDRRLENTSTVVLRFIESENRELAAGARAATQNPAFIAAFNKGGPGAILDLANSFRDILGADYVLITDNQAAVRARTDAPTAPSVTYDPPVVVQAIEGRQGTYYVNQADQRFYLAVATPLKDPASGVVLAVVVATRRVTDTLAADVKQASGGSDVAFYLLDSLDHPVVVASTVPKTPELQQVVATSVADLAQGGAGSGRAEATLGAERMVGRARPLQNQGSRHPMGGYLALRSRSEELAGFHRTQRTILFAGLVGLALALAGSWLVGRVIGRPVRALVGVTRRVTEGDYEAKPEITSRDEIGELAAAFQHMVEELKAKQQLVEVMSASSSQVTRPMYDAAGVAASATAARRAQAEPGMLAEGSRFAGRYDIKGVLGMGGMGVVYRAWDNELGELVAIKTLRMDAALAEPAALDRFKQEIRLARKITHRNVVRTHDLGEVDGLYFITMEYVEGQSLKHLIQARGSLPVNVALTVGKQLCRALEVAHEQGVIHRDIKPQNLIVEPSGTLKVMDFGIARLAKRSEGMTQAGMALGTPEYMAPEQLLGTEVDFRADLYATGAVLFESLTGRTPFVGDSAVTLVAKQIEETPPSPRSLNADVPEPLATVVLRALAKDPAERPQSAALLYEELDAIAV